MSLCIESVAQEQQLSPRDWPFLPNSNWPQASLWCYRSCWWSWLDLKLVQIPSPSPSTFSQGHAMLQFRWCGPPRGPKFAVTWHHSNKSVRFLNGISSLKSQQQSCSSRCLSSCLLFQQVGCSHFWMSVPGLTMHAPGYLFLWQCTQLTKVMWVADKAHSRDKRQGCRMDTKLWDTGVWAAVPWRSCEGEPEIVSTCSFPHQRGNRITVHRRWASAC